MIDGPLIDFSKVRSGYANFVGRHDLLSEIDELFLQGTSWVLVAGGPGTGKSALLAHYIERLESADAGRIFSHAVPGEAGLVPLAKRLFTKRAEDGRRIVPHHFIRYMHASWAAPATILRSLTTQMLDLFPKHRDHQFDDADPRCLAALLQNASATVLQPAKHRLILVLDGLDEVEWHESVNPLRKILPALPAGISVLCSTRPYYKDLDWIEQSGSFVRLDLDGAAASNDATCRAFVQQQLPELAPNFPEDEALRLSRGNLRYLSDLISFAKDESNAPIDPVPVGFTAFGETQWRNLNLRYPDKSEIIKIGFWVACMATDGVSITALNEKAQWSLEDGESFLRMSRSLLRASGTTDDARFRPFHHAFRDYLIAKLSPDAKDILPVREPRPVKKRRAFLVGVDGYPESPPLKYCVNDVIALAATLQTRGFEVVCFHDQQVDPLLLPTVDNIRAKFASMNGSCDPDDLFLVFFVCHGILSDGKAYLLGSDSRPTTIEQSGLAIDVVMDYMKAAGALRNVLLLDACHAGVNLGDSAVPHSATPVGTSRPNTAMQVYGIAPAVMTSYAYYLGEGDAILTGSSAAEKTLDWDAKQHSVFAFFANEGLSGAADLSGKGFVTFADLHRYTFMRVKDWWSRNFTGGQHQDVTARFSGSGELKIVELNTAAKSVSAPVAQPVKSASISIND